MSAKLSPLSTTLPTAHAVQSAAVVAMVAALSAAGPSSLVSRDAASSRRMKMAEASAAARDHASPALGGLPSRDPGARRDAAAVDEEGEQGDELHVEVEQEGRARRRGELQPDRLQREASERPQPQVHTAGPRGPRGGVSLGVVWARARQPRQREQGRQVEAHRVDQGGRLGEVYEPFDDGVLRAPQKCDDVQSDNSFERGLLRSGLLSVARCSGQHQARLECTRYNTSAGRAVAGHVCKSPSAEARWRKRSCRRSAAARAPATGLGLASCLFAAHSETRAPSIENQSAHVSAVDRNLQLFHLAGNKT
eukprot:scaffold54198_cov73-Phaeocystis_antarctica.AAC.8